MAHVAEKVRSEDRQAAIAASAQPDPVVSGVEAETLLPAQFFADARAACATGERRLMAAVLEDALTDYMKHVRCETGRGAWLFGDVHRWFQSHDRTWPFSFERICEALDVDARAIRLFLLERMTEARQTGRVAPTVQLRRRPVVRRGAVRI